MYRIVKRIVRTITTVTWSIRWEERRSGQPVHDEQIMPSTTYTVTAEEVIDKTELPVDIDRKPISNQDQGERS